MSSQHRAGPRPGRSGRAVPVETVEATAELVDLVGGELPGRDGLRCRRFAVEVDAPDAASSARTRSEERDQRISIGEPAAPRVAVGDPVERDPPNAIDRQIDRADPVDPADASPGRASNGGR